MNPTNVGVLASFFAGMAALEWLWLWIRVLAVICWCALVFDVYAQASARQQISALLDPKNRSDDAIAVNAIRAVFELVYALPLLFVRGRRDKRELGDADWKPLEAWWWALWPSMLLTVLATLLLTYFGPMSAGASGEGASTALWSGIAVNIFSDYLAVFVIRGWLIRKGQSWWQALLFALCAGILLVTSFTALRLVVFFMTNLLVGPCYPFGNTSPTFSQDFCQPLSLTDGDLPVSYLAIWKLEAVQTMLWKLILLHLPGVVAAWAVHLWLPILVGCAFILRLVNVVLGWAARVMWGVEWYAGGRHPVLALGVVAGGLSVAAVFVLPEVLELLHWLQVLS